MSRPVSGSERWPACYATTAAPLLCQVRYAAEQLRWRLEDAQRSVPAHDARVEIADLLRTITAAIRALAELHPDHARTAPGYGLLATLAGDDPQLPVRSGLDTAQIEALATWAHHALADLPRPPRRC